MRWPWVSRRAYEELHYTLNLVRVDLAQMRQSYGELVGDVIEMKREGFTAAPRIEPSAPVKELPGEIEAALDRLLLPPSLRSQMQAWAERQVARGREVGLVAKELMAGGLGNPDMEAM